METPELVQLLRLANFLIMLIVLRAGAVMRPVLDCLTTKYKIRVAHYTQQFPFNPLDTFFFSSFFKYVYFTSTMLGTNIWAARVFKSLLYISTQTHTTYTHTHTVTGTFNDSGKNCAHALTPPHFHFNILLQWWCSSIFCAAAADLPLVCVCVCVSLTRNLRHRRFFRINAPNKHKSYSWQKASHAHLNHATHWYRLFFCFNCLRREQVNIVYIVLHFHVCV